MTKREEFEDTYNPLKVYAFLRKGLNIERERASVLARWYEDRFYKVALRESNDEKQNKLESNL